MLYVDRNCCGLKKVEVSDNHPDSSWMITELSGTGQLVSINILPDNVLLEIFDHYAILSQ